MVHIFMAMFLKDNTKIMNPKEEKFLDDLLEALKHISLSPYIVWTKTFQHFVMNPRMGVYSNIWKTQKIKQSSQLLQKQN